MVRRSTRPDGTDDPGRPLVRLAVAAILVVGLFGLLGHHGATYDEAWPHPTGDQLAADYDRWVGERVLVWGTVESVDPDADRLGVVVERSDGRAAARLTVRGVAVAVEPGGVVQVHGRLNADRTIDARSAVVVNRSPEATRYKYAVSVLGLLMVGLLVLVHWRPSRRGLVPRSPDPEVDDR